MNHCDTLEQPHCTLTLGNIVPYDWSNNVTSIETAPMPAYIELKHRNTQAVLFRCELDPETASKPLREQLGYAVREAIAAGADLRGVVLCNVDLAHAPLGFVDFTDADLQFADFSFANLSNAKLIRALLRETNFSGAAMCSADLTDADAPSACMNAACLCDADLSGADLSSADLSETNMSHATTARTKFTGADLRDCRSGNQRSALEGA
jgi:uncharacterized protein YjbI with pentapeptide repeats